MKSTDSKMLRFWKVADMFLGRYSDGDQYIGMLVKIDCRGTDNIVQSINNQWDFVLFLEECYSTMQTKTSGVWRICMIKSATYQVLQLDDQSCHFGKEDYWSFEKCVTLDWNLTRTIDGVTYEW